MIAGERVAASPRKMERARRGDVGGRKRGKAKSVHRQKASWPALRSSPPASRALYRICGPVAFELRRRIIYAAAIPHRLVRPKNYLFDWTPLRGRLFLAESNDRPLAGTSSLFLVLVHKGRAGSYERTVAHRWLSRLQKKCRDEPADIDPWCRSISIAESNRTQLFNIRISKV